MNLFFFLLAITSCSVFSPTHGNNTMALAQTQQIQNFVRTQPQIPTIGTGLKHAYVLVSPYCPHCKTIMKHIDALMNNKQYAKQYTFHILWVSNAHDEPGRAACRYLMAANTHGLMMALYKEITSKFNMMEIKDFQDFQFKNTKNFDNVSQYDGVLDAIDQFMQGFPIEGLPALFYQNKSMMGAPDSVAELKDFLD